MVSDELKSVPSITLDQEDIAGRQSHRAPSHPAVDDATGSARPPTVAARWWQVLVPALAISLAATFWVYRDLQQTRQQLAAAAARIDQLEARLASTDTTITQSEVLLAGKLKSMDQQIDGNKGEIRKLWALAGDTQRKALEQAKATNDQQNATLKNLQEMVTEHSRSLETQQNALNQFGATAKNSETSAREAVQRMEIMSEGVGSLEAEVKTLKQKQAQQDSEYNRRTTALEDTAKSTDVFRRNTQEELRKMRDELMRQSVVDPKQNF